MKTYKQTTKEKAREKSWYITKEGKKMFAFPKEDLDTIIDILIDSTINDLITEIEESMGEEKDVSGEHAVDLVYRPPAEDGETVSYTHIDYSARKGFNQLHRKVTQRIKSLRE